METIIGVHQVTFRGEQRFNITFSGQTIAWNLYLNEDNDLMADTFGAELADEFFGADLVAPEGEMILNIAVSIIKFSEAIDRF